MTEMLRGVIASQASKVAHIIRGLPATVGTLKDAATDVVAHTPLLGGTAKGSSNLTLAPRTVRNASVTNTRAFATVSVPLAELKDIGRAFDATINDMVLMLCSSALRRYFGKRRTLGAHRQLQADRDQVFTSLTRREREVLTALAMGNSAEEIARTSYVSMNTVRTQIRNVLSKLDVASVAAAVSLAHRSRWLHDGDRGA